MSDQKSTEEGEFAPKGYARGKILTFRSATEFTEVVTQHFRKNEELITHEVLGCLASFVGVTPSTVTLWLQGRQQPAGGYQMCHLWHFLEALGTNPPGFVHARKHYLYGFYLGELFAYGVITQDEAKEFGGNVQTDAVKNAMRNQGHLSNVELSLADLQEMYGTELQKKKRELRDKLAAIHAGVDTETTPTPIPASAPALTPGITQEEIVAIVQKFLAAQPQPEPVAVTDPGLDEEQVKAIVEETLKEMPIPAPSAPEPPDRALHREIASAVARQRPWRATR